MKIIAVSNIKDEADIIRATITNLAAHGVDEIITTDGMSTDGTRDLLRDLSAVLPIRVVDDPCEFHHQHTLMNMVANLAVDHHADWIIPFDADEFWYATEQATIREALETTSANVLNAACYQYFDYQRREPSPKTFPKVAFRPLGPFDLSMGSHAVTITHDHPSPSVPGILAIREVQFRGYAHFCYKVRQRAAAFPPEVDPGNGAHVRRWAAMSDSELAQEWQEMDARATTVDPVPVDMSLVGTR